MKKHTYKFVKNEFEKIGYVLLEEEYINNSIKMKYSCNNGHINFISYNNLKNGKRCPNCFYIKNAKNKKFNFEFIKSGFEKKGYVLLDKEYINSQTKMKYKCSKGHINYIRWNDLQQNKGCPDCSNVKKHSYEFIKNKFEKNGYILLENEYINAHTKMKYRCLECDNINKITYANLSQNYGCPCCAIKKRSGKYSHFWNPNRDDVKINNKLSKLCICLLHRCLNHLNIKKSDRTYNLLGYTPKQLQEHLKTFKNYNSFKCNNQHLDHIIPIKAFMDYGVNNLKNLQPLNSKTNLKKSDKYRKKDFHKYMKNFPEYRYNKQTFKYEKIGK